MSSEVTNSVTPPEEEIHPKRICCPLIPSKELASKLRYFGVLKVLMFLFNGIIFLFGLAMLCAGIWVKVDSSSIYNFLEDVAGAPPELNKVLNLGYLLIAIGLLMLLIGFLGCFGAVLENQCMLLAFFVVVQVVFITELLGAVVILVFRPLANDLFSKVGRAAVRNIKKDFGKNPGITGLWNTTMNSLKCCGFYNSSDFVDSPYYVNNSKLLPPQCCPGMVKPCDKAEAKKIKKILGCFSKFKILVGQNTAKIVSVALAVALLEMFAMAVSMIVLCSIRYRED